MTDLEGHGDATPPPPPGSGEPPELFDLVDGILRTLLRKLGHTVPTPSEWGSGGREICEQIIAEVQESITGGLRGSRGSDKEGKGII